MVQTERASLVQRMPDKKIFLSMVVFFLLFTFSTAYAMAKENTVTVEAAVLNVRTGPGLSYEIMAQVVEDEELNVIEEKNEWYKVRLANDRIGWVASWLVKNTEVMAATNSSGVITASTANVRKEASTSSDILGTVVNGTELTVLFQQDGWTQVQYMGRVAWISSDLIEVVGPVEKTAPSTDVNSEQTQSIDTVTVRTNGTNIRSKPSVEAAVITTTQRGDSLTHIETEGDWYLVSLADGTRGYVASWVVDSSNSDTPAPPAMVTSLSEATIVVDAGHGGHDPGAVTDTFNEKLITLKTAERLANRLRDAGANVILTRDTDEYISLNDRVYYAHRAKADAFISIHYDALEQANVMSGTTTYYYSQSDLELAETINESLRTYGPLPNNGVREGNYFVLRENAQPSVLLELGYLNHYRDVSVVNTESYQSVIVESIYQALNNYFSP